MTGEGTNLDADEVARAAARLTLRAEDLKGDIAGPTEAIRGIHLAEPWGHDEYGSQFQESYLRAGDDGESAVESILGACEGICDTTSQLGENAGLGAITSRLVDEEQGDQFARAVDQLEGAIEDGGEAGQEVRDAGSANEQPPETAGEASASPDTFAGVATGMPTGGQPVGWAVRSRDGTAKPSASLPPPTRSVARRAAGNDEAGRVPLSSEQLHRFRRVRSPARVVDALVDLRQPEARDVEIAYPLAHEPDRSEPDGGSGQAGEPEDARSASTEPIAETRPGQAEDVNEPADNGDEGEPAEPDAEADFSGEPDEPATRVVRSRDLIDPATD